MVVLRRVEKQNINEAKQVGTLYHVCTLDALVQYIIPNNELKASGKYWNELLKTNQQVCFTRDPLFVVPTFTVTEGNILFQFVVDGDKLSERYKVTPFNYTTSPNQRYREKEEDVIGPIKNFKSYIKEVRFDIKDLNVDKNNIKNIINGLEKVKNYLGSIRCYRSELPFLDSHWNINFGKVKDPKYKIKTLDDLITILKSYIGNTNDSVVRISDIDTPDLFVRHISNLSSTQIKNIIDEYPKWIKYITLSELCKSSSFELVKFFIEKGADVNAKDADGDTSLIVACRGEDFNLTKLLIENGADVNVKDKYENTPLSLVCDNGNVEIAKLLIKSGADVNIRDNHGDTLLSLACQKNNLDIVKLLVKKGADVNVFSDGKTPLIKACYYDNLDIVKFLVKNGADVNVKDKYGNTPLLYACKGDISRIELVKFLVKNGANVNVKDKKGNTPLLLACSEGKFTTAKILIDNGADVNVKDFGDNTPLMIACKTGNLTLVKSLVKNGANVDGRNKLSDTALDIARIYQNKDLYRYLENIIEKQ